MITLESLIVPAAEDAGIKMPPSALWDQKKPEGYTEEYPHFSKFAELQLNRRLHIPDEAWANAKVIAAIPEEQLKTMHPLDFIGAGLVYPENWNG